MYYVARLEGGIVEEDEYCHDLAKAVALRNELNETEEWGEWAILWENEEGSMFEVDDHGHPIVPR